MSADDCQRPDCAGAYEDMGGGELYCDTCGLAPVVSPSGLLTAPPTGVAGAVRAAGSGRSGSAGSATGSSVPTHSARSASGRSTGSWRSVSGRLSRTAGHTSGRSVWVVRSSGPASSSGSSRLGAGLVSVEQVPRPDPHTAVLANPEVPERKRFCSRSE